MAAKELKALVDIGTALGYTGDELKQFISEERMRMDREKEEKEKALKEEKERVEKEKERERAEEEKEREREFELEKMKLEEAQKERAAKEERERIEKEKEREFELEKIKQEEAQKVRQSKEENDRIEAEKERVFQLENLKFEREEKDRAEREKEKERNYELEKITLEKDVEVQRIRSEHEFRIAEVNRQNEGDGDANGINQNNGARPAAMKALKLPPFNEDKDDLDAYLTRFERACTAFDVRPEHWSTQLARLLQGISLEVYQRNNMTDAEVGDYNVLKAQLLKRFRLTEGGYRKKFKTSKLELGETPEQFVERLRRYLIVTLLNGARWPDMRRPTRASKT